MVTVISFIVVMSILVFVHELGHFLMAKRNKIVVDEFAFGFPPRLIKLGERGGTVYAINAIPFGGYVKMRGEEDPTDPGSFAAASKRARVVVLLAGVAMNFLLAILLFSVLTLMDGIPDSSRPGALIQGVVLESPAAVAGLQVGDRIVRADDTPIAAPGDLQIYTRAHLGEPIRYEIIRTDLNTGATQTIELTITPRVDPPAGQGALGVSIGMVIRQATLGEAALNGVRSTGEVIALTFAVPAMLIREGRPIADAGFMGPVGIAVTTGEVVRSAVARETLQPIIMFVALLSAALGITNLLPIPGLDGGRLVFVLVEAVRGKRVEPAQEGLVHLVGIGLLLLLVSMMTIREVSSLINGTFPQIVP